MTKPDDMPQDVWDSAQRLFNRIDPEGSMRRDPMGDIASAIIAEREACARVAEHHGRVVSNEPIGQACSRNIASAIRNREAHDA